MGQEIADSHFTADDFDLFSKRLKRETAILQEWFDQQLFEQSGPVAGYELEAWIVDGSGTPAPLNERLIEVIGDSNLVPELALFNLELNSQPQPLGGSALSQMADELQAGWDRYNSAADSLDASLAMIGILPTASRADVVPANMSHLQRYKALDEQLKQLRNGRPIEVDIQGKDHLRFSQQDVMLESVTTSFQLHLQVDAAHAGRVFNASKLLSGPMVALSANSPYLFGADLWDESRIPLFEQSIAVGESDLTKRVSFGLRYMEQSIMECFQANLDRYPVLLPRLMDEPEEQLAHLRLHNGTIWRWNRPLIGFGPSGQPHVRIEHRVVPSGPTIADSIANAAFYFGAVLALAGQTPSPELNIPFPQAKENFYQAAQYGLKARARWLDGAVVTMGQLVLQLIPEAREGLLAAGIGKSEADHWLGIIRRRVESGQNGAVWQRAWVDRHGKDFQALTAAYMTRQESGRPVHEWTLN
ncbi:MAG: glutamate--cysteine ligase [Gammaproteobacteria bacterium]|nr:glutamate--cysteine ligase [Gammaproteobacteria bacterium]